MKLPKLKNIENRTRQQIIAFAGINYGQDYSDGQISESLNLSSMEFPCLTQRRARKAYESDYGKASAIYARGELCIVDGINFIYDGKVVGTLTEGEKQFATINTKVVIFPDKKYYDTESDKFGDLEVIIGAPPGLIEFTAESLTFLRNYYWKTQTGEETSKGGYGQDDSVDTYKSASVNVINGTIDYGEKTAKTYGTLLAGDVLSAGSNAFQTVTKTVTYSENETTKVRVYFAETSSFYQSIPDLNSVFSVGDAVVIEGCSKEENNATPIIRGIDGMTLKFEGTTFSPGTDGNQITVSRKIPEFTCVCESDNRIWGAEGSTIWASALGDPKNFYVYDGLSTDSYSAAVGTDGDFTGCIAFGSTVLFWKEAYLHKVLGNFPAQYEIYTYEVHGLQAGSHKSMAIINESLYYKGRSGVYVYNGGTPQLVSSCFGTVRYDNAVAGTDTERYYISMQDVSNDQWSLFVYDVRRGIWLREDDTHVADFAYLDGLLYCLDRGRSKIFVIGDQEAKEEQIPWSATFCKFTESIIGRKEYSRLYLRLDLEAGAYCKVEVSLDDGPFQQVAIQHDRGAKTATTVVNPNRCDNFTVRLSGKGRCMIKSLVREFVVGSEV